MPLGTEVGLGAGDIVLYGDPAPQKVGHMTLNFLDHDYCGQTVGWIKMKLGMEVGLVPGHIVLDGDPATLPQKGHIPQFLAYVCCGHTPRYIKMPLGTDYGGRFRSRRRCVRWRPSSPAQK